MEAKLSSVAVEVLGLRLTMKVPRLGRSWHRKEEPGYRVDMVRSQEVGEGMNNSTARVEREDSLLRYDNRVVNRLLSLEQLENIENWLSQQPEVWKTEEGEEEEVTEVGVGESSGQEMKIGGTSGQEEKEVDTLDGALEKLTKATNYYRDIANNTNKQQFLRKKIVTLV